MLHYKIKSHLNFHISVRLVSNELLVPFLFEPSFGQWSNRRHLKTEINKCLLPNYYYLDKNSYLTKNLRYYIEKIVTTF